VTNKKLKNSAKNELFKDPVDLFNMDLIRGVKNETNFKIKRQMTPMASTNRNFNLTLGHNFKAKPRF
jgi:hypothetical protein